MTVVVGIDENGLGPLLGPLIVTAVTLRCADAAAEKLARGPARGKHAKVLGDSKALSSFHHTALGESWGRAICGESATSPAKILEQFLLKPLEELRSRCPGGPSGHESQCWDSSEGFSAPDETIAECMRSIAALNAKGITIERVRIQTFCTERLNTAFKQGRSRLLVDLHAMEELVVDARNAAQSDVSAICGKVGGYGQYAPHFGPLASYLYTPIEEGRALSHYRVSGIGDVAFVRDADESSMVVGLASIIGKWTRDLFMRRIVRYHQAATPELTEASGYHDPVTLRFVKASHIARKARDIPDDCFLRAGAAEKSS